MIGDIGLVDAILLVAVAGYMLQQQRAEKKRARKSLTRKLTIREKLNHRRNRSNLNIQKSKD